MESSPPAPLTPEEEQLIVAILLAVEARDRATAIRLLLQLLGL